MSIESILEHRQSIAPVAAATLTTVEGNAVVSGTGLDAYSINDIIWWTDDLGVWQQNQVKIATSAIAMTLYRVVNSVTTAKIPRIITGANQRNYWFRANSDVSRAFIIRPSVDEREVCLLSAPGAGDNQISENEGILVKTVYIRLPYQYTMGAAPFQVGFYYVDTGGNLIGRVQSIGEDSLVFIHRENNEVEINAFIPPPSQTVFGTPGKWSLSATIETSAGPDLDDDDPSIESDQLPVVSQVNGPDLLNDQQMPVIVGARILHAGTFLT